MYGSLNIVGIALLWDWDENWPFPVLSNFNTTHGLRPIRLLCPWHFPGEDTGSGLPFPSPAGSSRPRDQIANIHWIIENAREFQENIYFCFIDYAKAFDCVDHNCGKFFKRWEYQTTLPASWEICMQDKKQQLELDMEQQNSSRLGKQYVKALYCLPVQSRFLT